MSDDFDSFWLQNRANYWHEKENTMATKTFVAAHDSIEAKMKKVSRNGQFTFLIFFDSSKLW